MRTEPLPRSAEAGECARCAREPQPLDNPGAYAYLLGLYLGDGCISGHKRGKGMYLRIACAKTWPGLITECEQAVVAVCPDRRAYAVQRSGDVLVTSYGHHWPCLFPQHAPGKKHHRLITLQPWQEQIVNAHPWEFIRGLVHSDGCRITNWTTRIIEGKQKRTEYPRYFFTNSSTDILALFCDTLDRVGVEWKPARQSRLAQNVSIAKRASVALMDQHVGPKY